MAYINVIQHKEAEGELLEVYDKIIETRGKLAEVHKIQSLNPKSIVNHMDLYITVMFGKSPLKRVQREMMAVVVSRTNDCEYCQKHHAEAVNHYWKDAQKVEQLKEDFKKIELTPIDQALCQLAYHLTKFPGKHTEAEFIQPLKDLGLNDRAILDATLIVAYFNFVNRIVLGLGVHIEENTSGYNYA